MEFRLEPSAVFPGQAEVVQLEAPGEGKPVLDGMHLLRQRRGVLQNLCHVCGRPTPRHDRYIFPISTGGFTVLADGSERYATQVPPVHLACARRAQAACPHLRRRYDQATRFPDKPGVVVFDANPPAHMEALAASLPPGGPVAFAYVRVHTAAFSRLVARLRRNAEGRDGEGA